MVISAKILGAAQLYLNGLKEAGLAREHISFEADSDVWPLVTHTSSRRTLVNWCSNSYLGLHIHPKVTSAAVTAINEHGVGATGTRNISGTNYLIERLESKVATYCNKNSAVIFQSAWAANFFIKRLADVIEGCYLYSDSENHNSMIMPLLATRAKQVGRVHKYGHNNIAELENLLRTSPVDAPKIILFEDIYSMSGEYAPMAEYERLAKEYDCLLFCDVTHSFGLYDDMQRFAAVDIISGTLGKAVGSQGGFIASTAEFAALARRTDSYIFSTSSSYANVSASIAGLEIISSAEGNALRASQKITVEYIRENIKQKLPQIDLTRAEGHILPLIIGDEFKCKDVAAKLFEKGIYLQPIFYPTVEKGKALLRLAPSALHTQEMAVDLIKKLQQCFETS